MSDQIIYRANHTNSMGNGYTIYFNVTLNAIGLTATNRIGHSLSNVMHSTPYQWLRSEGTEGKVNAVRAHIKGSDIQTDADLVKAISKITGLNWSAGRHLKHEVK